VVLELAVQEGLDDIPGDLCSHAATLGATLCDLLAAMAETTQQRGTSNLAQLDERGQANFSIK
jgi:hypothetical protein